jgi:hypothetical protein
MGAILDFLFGKDPDIFDEKGQVRHRFTDQKWQEWQSRFKDSEHNWREHAARQKNQPIKSTKPPIKS